jgi:hypothetical protein
MCCGANADNMPKKKKTMENYSAVAEVKSNKLK